ncbi:MAG: hypothetical protein ACU85U_18565 [Gammaproteobacteria bacterium]|jgi:hypothetical protein
MLPRFDVAMNHPVVLRSLRGAWLLKGGILHLRGVGLAADVAER